VTQLQYALLHHVFDDGQQLLQLRKFVRLGVGFVHVVPAFADSAQVHGDDVDDVIDPLIGQHAFAGHLGRALDLFVVICFLGFGLFDQPD